MNNSEEAAIYGLSETAPANVVQEIIECFMDGINELKYEDYERTLE
jgi:hypothetical protein